MASLHYKFASMNAGKSAQLLMVIHNYEERNRKVLVVKPTIDTRDSVYVRSRALNIKRKADIALHKADVSKIWWAVYNSRAKHEPYDAVIVDEVQFLTKEQIDELSDIVDDFETPVLCYGLRTDFNGNLFEGSRRLFEVADKFEEFKTVCPCCGRKAIINMRLDGDNNPIFHGDQVQAGENYLPVCRKYYKELKSQFVGGRDREYFTFD